MTAMRADIHPCPTCGKPALDGFSHRHSREAIDWDPMPMRPERLYCGPLNVNDYWTGADFRPTCCMVHVIAAEYRAELPEQLHPVQANSTTGLVPIPREPRRLDGPMLMVPDIGALGGWPWASSAHRRLGAVTMLDGEQTLHHGDYRAFPWAFAIERRLDGYCRRRHVTRPDLWWEHRGRPICMPIAQLILARGYQPESLVARHVVPAVRMRLILEDVLPWLWARVSDTVNGLDR